MVPRQFRIPAVSDGIDRCPSCVEPKQRSRSFSAHPLCRPEQQRWLSYSTYNLLPIDLAHPVHRLGYVFVTRSWCDVAVHRGLDVSAVIVFDRRLPPSVKEWGLLDEDHIFLPGREPPPKPSKRWFDHLPCLGADQPCRRV